MRTLKNCSFGIGLALSTAAAWGMSGCATADPTVETTTAKEHGELNQPPGWLLWPSHSIAVCFTTATWTNSSLNTWRSNVQSWLASSISSAANLSFTGFSQCGSNTNNMVTITHDPTRGNSQGSAGWQGSSAPSPIVFGLDGIDASHGQGVVIHEMMHTIGFGHEFNRSENSVNHDCSWQFDQGGGNVYGTPYDHNSIMNDSYCGYWNSLSTWDVIGLRRAYGMHLPLTPGKKGDVNGDLRADIVMTGPAGWNTVPVAFSNGNGTFNVTNLGNSFWASNAATAGVKVVSGDFDGDGYIDLAMAGASGWNTIPVGFSNRDGSFYDTNITNSFWASNAAAANVKMVAGDFNGDGRTDLAMMGNSGWNTVPVAFSNGDGSFNTTNLGNSFWASNAAAANVKVVTGDFNGDGRTDIAMMGNSGWNTVPVAFSNGNGTFNVTNLGNSFWASNAAAANVKVVSGDFNGDGRTDIAMMGNSGWNTVPVAFSNGDGTFNVTNLGNSFWASNAAAANVKVVTGDYNNDGRTDIAMMGNSGWNTVPVAFSNGDGTFNVTNLGNSFWASNAATAGVKVVDQY